MKTIRNIMLAMAFIGLAAPNMWSQQNATAAEGETSMFQTISKIEKKTDKFNLYFNMHGDAEGNWTNDEFDGAKFQLKQFRIEAKGNINSWLRYRYRQRLTKSHDVGPADNLLYSIDIAGLGVNLGKWDFFLGKQCASYGGIEFDLNPIEIYQYSDMVDYMSNFLTGVNIAYNFTPKQQLQFQVLDALNESSYAKYGGYRPTKAPFVYTLNWNGNFMDVYKTRWSASVMDETHGQQMYYFALGNDFNITSRWSAYFDWMYSIEGVDRKGIITDIVGRQTNDRMAMHADYMSFVLHTNYFITPRWNIFAKFMYETAGITKNYTAQTDGGDMAIAKGNYRTAYGYIAGIEYYPLKDKNLHFFATYVGRHYDYSARAKALGQKNYDTSRLSLGFIWQMPVF